MTFDYQRNISFADGDGYAEVDFVWEDDEVYADFFTVYREADDCDTLSIDDLNQEELNKAIEYFGEMGYCDMEKEREKEERWAWECAHEKTVWFGNYADVITVR